MTSLGLFEKGLLVNNEKLLSKMYKISLEWETRDELIKASMIDWAMDIGHNSKVTSW